MTFLSPISPVAPAAGYQGGKRNLARRICAIIETVDHDGYAEPFVGMGGIFLRRSARPRAEIINDISGDVATFFRVLQEHYPYLIDTLRWRVTSRAEFDRLMKQDPATLTDLRRAARFLYVQRLAFGGKIRGRNFGVDKVGGARFNIAKIEPMLADIHDRLAGVVIEQLPFADFIRRYDRPGMLFYLDPPYWDCENDYGAGVFSKSDFTRLANLMRAGAGKFLLSLNDTPGVRETFAGLAMQEIDTTYTMATAATGAGKRVGELLISNFEISAR